MYGLYHACNLRLRAVQPTLRAAISAFKGCISSTEFLAFGFSLPLKIE